jgi:hypothetical protein
MSISDQPADNRRWRRGGVLMHGVGSRNGTFQDVKGSSGLGARFPAGALPEAAGLGRRCGTLAWPLLCLV